MQAWVEDLLSIAHEGGPADQVFARVESAVQRLGFEHCAYGLRDVLSNAGSQVVMLNNYPTNWRVRYASMGYLEQDPTVALGRRSTVPLIWSDEMFASARHLWEDARAFGLRHGWAQSSLDAPDIGGMLTVSRSTEVISECELRTNGARLQLLTCVAHQALSRAVRWQMGASLDSLVPREREVLKWTAEGKSSQEAAALMLISRATIEYHVRNAMRKLGAPNKTAAAVRATMLGLLG